MSQYDKIAAKQNALKLIDTAHELSEAEKLACSKALNDGMWPDDCLHPTRKFLAYFTMSKSISDYDKHSLLNAVDALSIAPEPPEWDYGAFLKLNINCIAHATGLVNSEDYKFLALEGARHFEDDIRFFASTDFASFLINEKLKPYKIQRIEEHLENCMVFYSSASGKILHAGIYNQGIVTSVWGSIQGVITHKLWHVPENYGTELSYFRIALPLEEIEDSFIAYLSRTEDGIWLLKKYLQ